MQDLKNVIFLKKITLCFAAVIFTAFFYSPLQSQSQLFDYTLLFDGQHLTPEDSIMMIDMGNVEQGRANQKVIRIENTSAVPLWITNVRGSCGLSVPSWPRLPIDPGSSGTITMRYDSSRPGIINRHLTIIANTQDSRTILAITGMVVKSGVTP